MSGCQGTSLGTLCTHTDANMVDLRNREEDRRQRNETTFFLASYKKAAHQSQATVRERGAGVKVSIPK